jgi:KUP system potassium uptake protein
MVLWFTTLAISGVLQIAQAPRVLAAINPAHAVGIFLAAPAAGFVVLGAVAITGGEALYADMGHFGRFPIRPSGGGRPADARRHHRGRNQHSLSDR